MLTARAIRRWRRVPATRRLHFPGKPPASSPPRRTGAGLEVGSDAAQCRSNLVNSLNTTRALFVSFVGHATKNLWAPEAVFNSTANSQLLNGPCLPIMLPMTCLEGSFFDYQTPEVLAEALPKLVAGIKFEKSMRWRANDPVAFSRPIRWLVALLGDQVIPFEYAGLTAGNITQGLRFYEPAEKVVNSLDVYKEYLEGQGIILDPQLRKSQIREQVKKLSLEVGGTGQIDESLLDEVNQLVEAPTALRGSFDSARLALPPEVLVSVMKKHQRYFPVFNAQGSLMPYFIAVRNGDNRGLDLVADGNEQVVHARFADAQFFIAEDLQHKLENMLEKLETLTFQHKLGSMRDKSKRVTTLVEKLADEFNLNAAEKATAIRAAELSKADLVTHMVVEMTSLQGIMGRYYALHSGETSQVADAILEHYQPRYTGDAMPASKAGFAVGIADRLDSLAGLFAEDSDAGDFLQLRVFELGVDQQGFDVVFVLPGDTGALHFKSCIHN